MSEAKHTPGPWKIEFLCEHDGAFTVRGEEIGVIAARNASHLSTESVANCFLIAAAPELLEACEDLLFFIQDEDGLAWGAMKEKLELAIAKAKGASSFSSSNEVEKTEVEGGPA